MAERRPSFTSVNTAPGSRWTITVQQDSIRCRLQTRTRNRPYGNIPLTNMNGLKQTGPDHIVVEAIVPGNPDYGISHDQHLEMRALRLRP
jgi:hypothetical protein